MGYIKFNAHEAFLGETHQVCSRSKDKRVTTIDRNAVLKWLTPL